MLLEVRFRLESLLAQLTRRPFDAGGVDVADHDGLGREERVVGQDLILEI